MHKPFTPINAFFLFTILAHFFPAFSQNVEKEQPIVTEGKVRTITITRHNLPTLNAATGNPVPSEKKLDDPQVVQRYYFNKKGLADSVIWFGGGQKYEKEILSYNDTGKVYNKERYRYAAKITKETEKIYELPDGNFKFEKYFDDFMDREIWFNRDSIIYRTNTYNGNLKPVLFFHSEYDITNETIFSQRYDHGKIEFSRRYQWVMKGEKPDSVIYTFVQAKPGKGRMPSFSYKMKVLEDGSVIPPQFKKGEIKQGFQEVNFNARYSKMWDLNHPKNILATHSPLITQSEISESETFSGEIYREYFTYTYEFYD